MDLVMVLDEAFHKTFEREPLGNVPKKIKKNTLIKTRFIWKVNPFSSVSSLLFFALENRLAA